MATESSDRLRDRIERSVVTVSTPNEKVFGELRGETDLRVWFAPGHYEQVGAGQLATELSTVARLLFVGHVREHAVAQRDVFGRVPEKVIALGRREREYAEALATLAAEGVSDDGSVRVTSIGQQNYVVSLDASALDRLDQHAFAASCTQAAGRLLADTEQQAAAARWRIYDPLPGLKL